MDFKLTPSVNGVKVSLAAASLVANGSFEDTSTADAAKAAGWDYGWYQNGGTYSLTTSGTAHGTQATRVTNAAGYLDVSSKAFPVVPGEQLYVSVWGRANAAHAAGRYIELIFGTTEGFSSPGTERQVDTGNQPWTTSWVQYQGIVTVPAAVFWCRLSLFSPVGQGVGAWAEWDGAVVQRTTTGSAISVPLTLTAPTAASVILTLKGAASQTANLTEWQNSAGTVLAKVNSAGEIYVGSTDQMGMFTGGGAADICTVANIPLRLNTFSNGTVYIGAGSTAGLSVVGGAFSALKAASIASGAAGTVGLVVQGAASQTGNLQEWQNSGGTVLVQLSATGDLSFATGKVVSTSYYTAPSNAGPYIEMNQSTVNVINRGGAALIPLLVSGMASQSGNLTEWRNSAGTTLTRVDAGGGIALPGGGPVSSQFFTSPSNTGPFLILNDYAVTVANRTDPALIPLIVLGLTSQTGNLQEWRNSVGTTLAFIASDGQVASKQNVHAWHGQTAHTIMGAVGPGSTSGVVFGTAADTNLYRQSANVLQTDDDFRSAALMVANAYTASQVDIGHNGSGVVGGFNLGGDVNLYRSAANILQTDDEFRVVSFVAAQTGSANTVTLGYNGTAAAPSITFGSAADTNLYRAAADTLKTDDILIVGGAAGAGVATPQARNSLEVAVSSNSRITLGENSEGDAHPAITFYRTAAGFEVGRANRIYVPSSTRGLVIQRGSGTSVAYGSETYTTIVEFTVDDKLLFGPEGSQDTNLYRSGANILATDDVFAVGGRAYLNPAGYPDMYVAAVGSAVFQGRVDGDTQSRILVYGSGQIWLGSGSAVADTNLYRSSADTLKTDDSFVIGANGGKTTLQLTDTAANVGITIYDVNLYRGAANEWKTDDSFIVGVDLYPEGSIIIGPPGARDVNLYRSAANVLKTDDALVVAAGATITTGAAGTVGLIVKGAASQTAALQQWQDSAGTVQASIRNDGMYRGPFLSDRSDTGPYIQLDTGVIFVVNRTAASNVPFVIVGMAGQTGDLQRWQDSAATVLIRVTAAGQLQFGSAGDTNLYRVAAGVLKTDSIFQVGRAAASDLAVATLATGDVANRFLVYASGLLEWGTGGGATDTNLYRAAASQLRTDDEFVVAGNRMYILGNSFPGIIFRNASNADRASIVAGQTDGELYLDYGVAGGTNAQVYFRSGVSYTTRVIIGNDGKLYPGPTPGDTNLYRSAANVLKTDDQFQAAGYVTANEGVLDAVYLGATAPGTTGPGLAFGGAADTNLYRSSADTLKSDDLITSAVDIIARQAGSAQVAMGSYGPGSTPGFLFGSAVDTNLYRSAANTLKTDDQFRTAVDLFVRDGLSTQLGFGDVGGVPGITFGSGLDTNLYRSAADTLKTDDHFITGGALVVEHSFGISLTTDATFGIRFGTALDTNLYRSAANVLKTDDTLVVQGDTYVQGTLYLASDTNLYRSAANVLKTDDLFDASVAGLRTKHEASATPTGGNSGEVRAGSSKLWLQDAGTWREIPAGFASTVKWMTD